MEISGFNPAQPGLLPNAVKLPKNDFRKFQDLTAYQRVEVFERFKNNFSLDRLRRALFRFDKVNGKTEIALMEISG